MGQYGPEENILISRTQGIMTIDGAEYFKDMEQKPGSWHMVKSEPNLSKMSDMIEDTRNALYGAYPQGVFARPVPLSADDISASGLPHDPDGAAASPLQGGLPAASSASIGSAYEAATQDSFRARPQGAAPANPWRSQPMRISWPPIAATPAPRVHASPKQVVVPDAFRARPPSQAEKKAAYKAAKRDAGTGGSATVRSTSTGSNPL